MKCFERILDIAEGNFGLVTFAQACALGISIRELSRWVKAGRLEKPARGLYRVARFPFSENDAFAVATEAVGAESYLFGESVLALLKLVPTNPTWIYVATPKRCRKSPREGLVVLRGTIGYVPTSYGGIRAQYVADAIRACRATVRPDRRMRAAREGLRQGYLTKDECRKLVKEIGNDITA